MTNVLLAYDGSEDADAALAAVPSLFPGAHVTVACVWRPFIQLMTDAGIGAGYAYQIEDPSAIDESTERHAREGAEAAVTRLREAGVDATAHVTAGSRSAADDLVEIARELDADVIVAGTRGRSGLRSVLLGSVSHTLLQHADRPVLVIPSPAVAAGRVERRHHHANA